MERWILQAAIEAAEPAANPDKNGRFRLASGTYSRTVALIPGNLAIPFGSSGQSTSNPLPF